MRGGTSCASIVCGRCIVFIRWAFVCLVVPPLQGSLLAFAVYPGFHIGLCPHFTLGFAGVSPFQGSLLAFSVSPGFHIGLCPHFTLGYAGVPPLQGSFRPLSVFLQGFISGFALIPPWAMRGCRPYRAHCRIGCLRCCVVVLCSLNVFGCVNGLLRSFVFLFDCDCMVCGIEGDCL